METIAALAASKRSALAASQAIQTERCFLGEFVMTAAHLGPQYQQPTAQPVCCAIPAARTVREAATSTAQHALLGSR